MNKIFLSFCALFFLHACAGPEKKIEEIVFYPSLPERPRLQFLTSISSEDDIGKKQSAFKSWLLGEMPSIKRIERPYDIGASEGKIYVVDRLLRKILIVDIKNGQFDFIQDKKEGKIKDPAGIWITEDDHKYLADFERKQILVYDNNNEFIRAYGTKDQFDKPLDVAVYEDRIYVCDFNRHEVVILDKDSGETVGTLGGIGSDEKGLYRPAYIFINRNGDIFINDSFNFRIQVFNQQGEFVKSIGYHGDTVGGFSRPKGIAVDHEEEEHLYAADAAFENVQIFDVHTAEILLFFGGFTQEPGGMYLPSGVNIDYANVGYFNKYVDKDFKLKYLVYVANMLGGSKLNIYGFGDWTGAILPQMEK